MWRLKIQWNNPDWYTNLFLGAGIVIGKYEFGIVIFNLFVGFDKEYRYIE